MSEVVASRAAGNPAAWLLLEVGEDRQHGGNTGYDDVAATSYRWDSSVPNHARIEAGDLVVLWDKKAVQGMSAVSDISTGTQIKQVFRCPSCGRSGIKQRKTGIRDYWCYDCRTEFPVPVSADIEVTTYRAGYEPGWTDLNGLLDGPTLRNCAVAPKSQLSLRPLDWTRFSRELTKADPTTAAALRTVQAASQAADRGRREQGNAKLPRHGHRPVVVRARIGQGAFRSRLIERFGVECALTGPAPPAALEAAHLYRYAERGHHEDGGGLLLRRDIHALFDGGLITVDDNMRIRVDTALKTFPTYSGLDGAALWAPIGPTERRWLADHHRQFRPAAG